MAIPLKRAIGLKIRAARKRKRLTQEELAERIERTVETVSNAERGRNLPSIETLVRIAEVLGVPLAEFFAQDDFSKGATGKRAQLELELRELARTLPDRELTIAISQVRALLTSTR